MIASTIHFANADRTLSFGGAEAVLLEVLPTISTTGTLRSAEGGGGGGEGVGGEEFESELGSNKWFEIFGPIVSRVGVGVVIDVAICAPMVAASAVLVVVAVKVS